MGVLTKLEQRLGIQPLDFNNLGIGEPVSPINPKEGTLQETQLQSISKQSRCLSYEAIQALTNLWGASHMTPQSLYDKVVDVTKRPDCNERVQHLCFRLMECMENGNIGLVDANTYIRKINEELGYGRG